MYGGGQGRWIQEGLTARDSSLIMCRTRLAMFPTASSAQELLLAIQEVWGEEENGMEIDMVSAEMEVLTKRLCCLQLDAPLPDI